MIPANLGVSITGISSFRVGRLFLIAILLPDHIKKTTACLEPYLLKSFIKQIDFSQGFLVNCMRRVGDNTGSVLVQCLLLLQICVLLQNLHY